jgi:adenylyl cyclase-associated protein
LQQVTKDKQTWRKEFADAPSKAVVVVVPTKPAKKVVKKKPTGLPIMEYQERGTKWIIENQTKESVLNNSENGVLVVDVTDPKQQVYIFNCDEMTVQIKGAKLKSVIIDTCSKVNVLFDTLISGCEIVNSKKVAIQVDGVCPVFSIDKTIGVTLWMSEATAAVSSCVVSMSSEMNVSIPDGDDRKEMPIPEQFVHRVLNGVVKSEVSDLYH